MMMMQYIICAVKGTNQHYSRTSTNLDDMSYI